MTLLEMECCGIRPKIEGRVRGRGQSERSIQVMMLRFGVAPAPRCESYKGRSGPSAFLAMVSLPDVATTRLLLPGLRLLVSAHTTLNPPTYLVPPSTPSTHSGLLSQLHSGPSFTPTVSTRAAEARDDAPAVGYRTTEHSPQKTYCWRVRAIKYKGTEIVASTTLPSCFNTPSSSVVCVCVCACMCVSWRLSA